MLTLWAQHMGTAEAFTVREVIGRADWTGTTEFRDALLTVAGDGRASINAKRLGKWLAAHQGRIVAGLTFRRTGGEAHGGLVRWRCVAGGHQ